MLAAMPAGAPCKPLSTSRSPLADMKSMFILYVYPGITEHLISVAYCHKAFYIILNFWRS